MSTKCPNCKRPLRPGARFCGFCGTTITLAGPGAPTPPPAKATPAPAGGPVCPYCKAPLRPGVRFCANCGKPLPGQSPVAAPVSPAAQAPGRATPPPVAPPPQPPAMARPPAIPKKRSRGRFVIYFGLLTLLCLVIAIPTAFVGKKYIAEVLGLITDTPAPMDTPAFTDTPAPTQTTTETVLPTTTETFVVTNTVTLVPTDTPTNTVTITPTPIPPTVTNTPTPATPLLRDDFSDQNAQNWDEWGEGALIDITSGTDPAMQLNTTSLISGGASSIVDTISLVPGLEISFTALVNYPASTSSTASAPQLRFAWSPGIAAPWETSEDLGVEIIISPLEVRITIYKADRAIISEIHILTATENTYRVEVKDDGSLEFYLNDDQICENLSVPIPPYTLSGGRIHFSGNGLVDDVLVIVEP